MKLIFTLMSLLPVGALMAMDAVPLNLESAAKQRDVTTKSLDEEFLQRVAYSMQNKLENKLELTELRFKQAESELKAMKELSDRNIIPKVKYEAAYLEFRKLEVEMINLPIEVVKAKLVTEYRALRLKEEGNPGQDSRRKQAELMYKGTELEIETLTKSLKVAEIAKGMAKTFLESGHFLNSSNALTKLELQRRKVILNSTILQIKEIKEQIEIARQAQESFAAAIARL